MLSRKRQVFILILYICSVYVLLNGPVSSRFFEYSSHLLDARPCGCHTCLTESDPWFMKRFNKTLKPFLTKENNISEEIFDWWKRLQGGRYTFTDYREAVDKLFEILPDNQYVTEPSPDRCRTCAVVGNSGNLKGSHYGPLIDSHDLIIRMNRGRTKGYEADVGTRTTHHVMYPESAKNVANTTRTVIFPFKTKDFFWLVSAFTTDPYQNVKARIKVSKEMIMVVSPVFMKYVHQIWLENPAHTYPSTGFLTLILSMHMCDEVSVFGFGADSDGNWGHYFELLRNKKFGTGLHKGPHEYRIIQNISNLHVIQMYKGW